MTYPTLFKPAALVLAALCAPLAWAQTTQPTPAVMTDVAPLPAQERNSMGAILMTDAPVLAQREAFDRANERTRLASSIGRQIVRATLREQTRQELAQMRALEAARFMDRGAGALDEK